MFSKKDIDVIVPFIAAYDSYKPNAPQVAPSEEKDDFTSMLEGVNIGNSAPPPPPPLPLPNLYLASIVYYSSNNWSVWINDRKLVNSRNAPSNELYVSSISAKDIELVWKPSSMLDTAARWKILTGNGVKPLPGINIDLTAGIITLHMHPNQTFLPRSLAIREGLIISPNPVHNVAPRPTGPTKGKPVNAKTANSPH